MMKQRRRRLRLALVGVLVLLLVSMGLVLATGEMLPRSLVSGGGGTAVNGEWTLHLAVGQPAVGAVTAADGQTLCGGFWCGLGAPEVAPVGMRVYLPVVARP